MTVLVTGGAGFIGANFIFYQLTHHPEDRVVCLDKLTYAGYLETLADVMEDAYFRFVQGDIADAQAVERLFLQEKPDYVVNFAAESHVDRSITQPDLFLKTNVLGTGVLLDACRRHGVTRYHQVSTDEVYGDLPLDRPDLFFTEETPNTHLQPLFCLQGGGGSAGAGLRPHLRVAGHGKPVLHQLRHLPLPGEVESLNDHPGAGRSKPAGVRHRRECAGLAVCGGSLRRH